MDKSLIAELNNYSLITEHSGEIKRYSEKGIKTLLCLYRTGAEYGGGAVYDKVIGKAAAALIILLGFKEVYAKTISGPALELLKQNKAAVSYSVLTDNIMRSDGKGLCLMEEACSGCASPLECAQAVLKKLKG